MLTPTDRKIMMLNKIVNRSKKQKVKADFALELARATIGNLEDQLYRFRVKLRGVGARAPIPDELKASYVYALEYVSTRKYPDQTIIQIFKDPTAYLSPTAMVSTVLPVVSWRIIKLDEGLYDLDFDGLWGG